VEIWFDDFSNNKQDVQPVLVREYFFDMTFLNEALPLDIACATYLARDAKGLLLWIGEEQCVHACDGEQNIR